MSQRAFATGSTGSGKTTRLRTLFAERVPRSLVLDAIGNPTDWLSWPGVQVADSEEEVAALLRDNAGRERWRLLWLTELQDPAVERVMELLVNPKPRALHYAAAVGGMALVIDEVAELMPNKNGKRSLQMGRLWRQGRHRGLSIFAASQRLPDVSRTVTGMSRYLICCPQHEPRDLEHLSERLPPHVMAAAAALQPRHCVLWDVELKRGGLLDPDGKVLQQFS